MSDRRPNLEGFLEEVDGYASAFFYRLELFQHLIFDDENREQILEKATLALGKHMTEYAIKARTIDAFKLVGNLGYFAAINVQSRVIAPNANGNYVQEVCVGAVNHLYKLGRDEVDALKDEGKIHTSSKLELDPAEEKYLAAMLYNEVCKKGDIGVGANGIGAIFSFMIKALKTDDSLD